MDKRGLWNQYVILIIMGFVLVGIMALYWVFSLVAPPLTSAATTGVRAIQTTYSNEGNISNAINNTIVPVNRALENLQWISYTLLIVMLITFVLIASYVRTYPFLLPVWLGICSIIIFISIVFAKAYSNSSGANSALWSAYSGNAYYLGYLPYIMTAIAILGGVVLMVLVSRDNEAEVVI